MQRHVYRQENADIWRLDERTLQFGDSGMIFTDRPFIDWFDGREMRHRDWPPVLWMTRRQQQRSNMSLATDACVERARGNTRARPWTFRGASIWHEPRSGTMPGVFWTLARGRFGDNVRDRRSSQRHGIYDNIYIYICIYMYIYIYIYIFVTKSRVVRRA